MVCRRLEPEVDEDLDDFGKICWIFEVKIFVLEMLECSVEDDMDTFVGDGGFCLPFFTISQYDIISIVILGGC